jgi:hypothetical protein
MKNHCIECGGYFFMIAWEGQYQGNLIDSLIESAHRVQIRQIAEDQRACIHCGEEIGNHSGDQSEFGGDHCPNRTEKGPLYLETVYE